MITGAYIFVLGLSSPCSPPGTTPTAPSTATKASSTTTG